MLKFRRTIAVLLLALFTCQSIMAGVDEHADHPSDSKQTSHLLLDHVDHAGAANHDHGQALSPDVIDGDCCHAHGHCHLLAFSGQLANVSTPPMHGLDATHGDTYNLHFLNTLLRPPTHA